MIFRFVVQHLRWLTFIPGATQIFDSMLLAWTFLAHRPRLAAMESLEAAARQMPGVSLRVHRLGGIEFVRTDREIGHLHGNGLMDVRVGREQACELVRAGRASPHHVFGDSAWISFWMHGPDDVVTALDLMNRLFERASKMGSPRAQAPAWPLLCPRSFALQESIPKGL